MKLVKVAEYEEEMADFVVYILKKAGIKAESQYLIHSCKDELSEITGKEWCKGWKPNRRVMVPEKDEEVADEILERLTELNWYKKKPKMIDVTKDAYPQLYGIKPWTEKKKKKGRKRR